LADPITAYFAQYWGEIVAVVIGGIILLALNWTIQQIQKPKIEISFEEASSLFLGRWFVYYWYFKNSGHGVASNVRAVMKVICVTDETNRNPSTPTPASKEFPLFSEEEIPTKKANRDRPYARLVYQHGVTDFAIFRKVKAVSSRGVTEIEEIAVPFDMGITSDGNHVPYQPAGIAYIQIYLEGDNLREKDRITRWYVLRFTNSIPSLQVADNEIIESLKKLPGSPYEHGEV